MSRQFFKKSNSIDDVLEMLDHCLNDDPPETVRFCLKERCQNANDLRIMAAYIKTELRADVW
ncbi:MAG TPA: hypothetical protein VLG49_04095 [Rhabdochlamydiaceae bacterium]|nr:hypothetical protein [Rhabdochlamydiaceae bacterium]